jgi:hypothetical protein
MKKVYNYIVSDNQISCYVATTTVNLRLDTIKTSEVLLLYECRLMSKP